MFFESKYTGGSVINALLATGKYRVRSLTLNPESDKAKALVAKGAEAFKANLSNREDVKNALNGADIAFIVTNFFDLSIFPDNMAEEERQGKMIADIAKEVGLNWLLYSSLPDTPDYKVIHFYNKKYQFINFGYSERHIYLHEFLCYEFWYIFPVITKEDETSEFVVPLVNKNTTIEIVDPETDTGITKVIEEGPEKWNGKKVPAVSESISFGKIAKILTKVTGRQFKLRSPGCEETEREFPYLASEEMLDMSCWFNSYRVVRSDKEIDISITKILHPYVTTFEQYAYKK
ncbi:16357_t:CDS:2 [Cetraspora pellucida]|uniref:16357_t:CDS:1 n=1 Tax=Cetraspora pellucida TaxID=1433469 RepID=A0A9N9HE46_9GLOM|nr:16357_t:CDS:2 [Cetraspora pellucida]